MLETIRIQRAVNKGDFAKAIAICHKLLAIDKKDVFALHSLALIYNDISDQIQSARYARIALEIEPQDAVMLNLYTKYCLKNKNYMDAYRHACRFLEAETIYPIELPACAYWIPKRLSIIRKFRQLENIIKENIGGMNATQNATVNWAKEYKVWYESENLSRSTSSLH